MNHKPKKVAVFGDAILDLFSYYTSPRESPEASVPIIIKEKEEYFAGGAALLSSKLSELGIKVDLYTQIGKDSNSKILNGKLKKINVFDYSKSNYKTTIKERIIVENKYYLRKDTEEIQSPFRKSIIDSFKEKASRYDAVIFSDYAKGFIDYNLFNNIKAICLAQDLLTFIDPSIKNKFDFKNIDYFKPNFEEAVKLSGRKNLKEILEYLSVIYNTIPVITLGESGSASIDNKRVVYSRKYKTKTVDTSGSGDIFFAYFVYSILNNKTLFHSLNYSSKEASKHVKFFGFSKN
tara:strand:+ start:817 stop:1692 length:876 start_codon:yes stop_codon:yes gene_type:complete